jgi:hypothetical protein
MYGLTVFDQALYVKQYKKDNNNNKEKKRLAMFRKRNVLAGFPSCKT